MLILLILSQQAHTFGSLRNSHIIHLDWLPPQDHALVTGVHEDGNNGGDPALAMDACKGTHSSGNGSGGTCAATTTETVMFGETPLPFCMLVGAVEDDAKRCHGGEE
jgi:hypothetical protein